MKHVNLDALYASLDTKRAALNTHWRDVAHQTGLSASTFTRIKNGSGIDLDGYTASCRWLGVSLDTFTTPPPADTNRDPGIAHEMVALLNRHGIPSAYWRAITDLVLTLRGEQG